MINKLILSASLYISVLCVTNAYSQITVNPGHAIVCNNATTSFYANSSFNGSFQWQDSSSSHTWSNLSNGAVFNGVTNDTLKINFASSALNNTYYRCIVDSAGLGIKKDTSNNCHLTVLSAITKPVIASNQIICFNTQPDTIKRIQNAQGANGVFSYQWQTSTDGQIWINQSSITDSTLMLTLLNSNRFIRLRATSTAGCGISVSDSIKIIVLPDVSKPSILGSQTICYNTKADTIKLVINTTGADGQFSYQWQSSLNGTSWSNIHGFTGDSLLTGNLTTTTFYRLSSVSLFGCGTYYSDSINVTVYDEFKAGLIENSQSICYGTSPTRIKLRTQPTGGGGVYSYQWQSSSDSLLFYDMTNETFDSLSLSNIVMSRFYRLKILSNSGCGVVFSNVIKINVYPALNKTDINLNNTEINICFNSKPDTFTFNILPSGGTGVFTNQWESSTDGITFSNIIGSTSIKFNPGILSTSIYYRVISTSSAGCGSIISDTIFVNMLPSIKPPTIGNAQSICYNTQPKPIRIMLPATGADGRFSYQWQQSNDGYSWINSVGASSDSLSIGLLSLSTFYRIKAISLFGCDDKYSDSIYINVYAKLNSGVIIGNQNICYQTLPSSIRLNSPNSGGGETYNYQWQESIDSNSFVDILGAVQDSLYTGSLVNTKFYKLVSTSNFGCGQISSNIIKVYVYDQFRIGTITGNDTICDNSNADSVKVSFPTTGGDNIYSYKWIKSTDTNNWSVVVGNTDNAYRPTNLRSSTYYSLIVSSGSNCGTDTSNWVYIHVNPLPDTAMIIGLQSVCRNQRELVYRRATINNSYEYLWDTKLGTIQFGKFLDSCYVHWGIRDGTDSVKLIQKNPITGCSNTMILLISIKESQSPNQTSIKRKPNSNILVCEDQQPGIIYQWGYINKQTGLNTDIPNANLQYVQLPFQFDTTIHIYYVRTSLGDCSTISYYNYEPLPVGIKESASLVTTIYPNPSAGYIHLKCNEKIESLSITDLQGKSIQYTYETKEIGIHSIKIDESVPSGLYFIRLMVRGEFINHKIILTK